MDRMEAVINEILRCVFDESFDLTTAELPESYSDWASYTSMLRQHVCAEMHREMTGALESADSKTIKIKPTACGATKIRLPVNKKLGFGLHLALVRVRSTAADFVLGVLISDSNPGWYSVAIDQHRTLQPVSKSAVIEVLASFGECAKQLYALDNLRLSTVVKDYLLGLSAPPPLHNSAGGWEVLRSRYGMQDAQAQAVARFLSSNTTGGVNLLEGPPGTGKSHTIAALVRELLETSTGRKIVITCPRNAGLSSIALKLRDSKCKFILYASKEKIDDSRLHEYVHDNIGDERAILCTMSRCFNLYQKFAGIRDVELIVDEAALASEPLSLIPFLLRPARCLLVGDIHQLQPHTESLEAARQHFNRSLMERLQLLSVERFGIAVPRLGVCFRFGPTIGEFVNKEVYEGELTFQQTETFLADQGLPFGPMHMVTHNGLAGKGHVNYPEMQVICNVLRMFRTRSGVDIARDVVILSFYLDHKEALERYLRKKQLDDVPTHTVDSFQGNERKIVLVTFARTDGVGFMRDLHRLNVALTRAQHSLVLIGNFHKLRAYAGQCIFSRLLEHLSDNDRARSLRGSIVNEPAVKGILADVDTHALGNYFNTLPMHYLLTLTVKKLAAKSLSSSVNPELVEKALQCSTDHQRHSERHAVGRYLARKYEQIEDGEGPMCALLQALSKYHLASDKSSYRGLLAHFQDLTRDASVPSWARLVAESTAIWIRYRLLGSLSSKDCIKTILRLYQELDGRCKAAHGKSTVICSMYLVQWGIVLQQAKKWDKAREVLRRVADIPDPDVHALNFDDVYNARCLLGEGNHSRTGKALGLTQREFDEVRLPLLRAVELSENYRMQRSWAYEKLAGLYMDNKSYGEAIKFAKEALFRHHGNVHAYRVYQDALEHIN